MKNNAVANITINKFSATGHSTVQDVVAVEEPLEISIAYKVQNIWQYKTIAVTMRTPGKDKELAIGFLYTEQIITLQNTIEKTTTKGDNKICIYINGAVNIGSNIERNFYTTSSCGVCGKASIESVLCKLPNPAYPTNTVVNSAIIMALPNALKTYQASYNTTGGIHAAAIFNTSGILLSLMEDVGRHNALDKIIGHVFENHLLPLHNTILLLSGRASFELVQKATIAQLPIVCAIGAPSSLAVSLAQEVDITLIGFLKNTSLNIYSGNQRIEV
jgi:FdhD protein